MQEIHVDSRMVFIVLSLKLRLQQFWIQSRLWSWVLWMWMGGLTGSLITRSSCHLPCLCCHYIPNRFTALHMLQSHTLWRGCEWKTCHLGLKAPIWSFPFADIISSSCFSTRDVHSGPSALCAKNSNQSLFLQSDWIRDESWSWQEEEM